MDQYLRQHIPGVSWRHEVELKALALGDGKFNVDMHASTDDQEMAVLLKAPVRSMGKNRMNSAVNLWGEAVRLTLLREGRKKRLAALFVTAHPMVDIIIQGKTAKGTGKTIFRDYTPISAKVHNAGFSLLPQGVTRCRYVDIPYSFVSRPNLKSLGGVVDAFEAMTPGSRIFVEECVWKRFDEAIEWLVTPALSRT